MVNEDRRVAKPFKSLNELYSALENLEPWFDIVKLRESTEYVYSGQELEKRSERLGKLTRDRLPKTLVCHDMKGGYLEDRFLDGSEDHESYLFYHWSVIDIFVYFSHHLVTIPPYGWINIAHKHGVKVLGTIITEQQDGEKIWEQIFSTPDETTRFADALVTLAKFYKFEGWLLNVENKIKPEDVDKLTNFVQYLNEKIHREIKDAEVIWYDSVTKEGQLKWQNELNEKNEEFFNSCDGIFLNYNWTDASLERSRDLAGLRNRVRDVFVGIDVWGRGNPGGGGLNSVYALEKIRKFNLSAAIFAPGWTHENFGPSTFDRVEKIFWAQLAPLMYVHVPIYDNETMITSFCRGSGRNYCQDGVCDETKPFYNLSLQNTQASVPALYLKFISINVPIEDPKDKIKIEQEKIFETIEEIIKIQGNKITFQAKEHNYLGNYVEFNSRISFNGGGCLKLNTSNIDIYHRLLLVHLEFETDIQVVVIHRESEEDAQHNLMKKTTGPTLVLINDTSMSFLEPNETFELDTSWRESYYAANMRTITEVGLSLLSRGSHYLGQIKFQPLTSIFANQSK